MLKWLGDWMRGDSGREAETGDNSSPPIQSALKEVTQAPAPPAGGFDTGGLLGEALSERRLLDAWERVRDNDGAAGVDGQDIAGFAHNVLGRLQQLRSEVMKGSYQPQPLKRVAIPKPSGGERWLAIPAVRDRVLQTAVAAVLKTRLEPEFEDASYAYRPGRSVAQAVARVVRHRDSGMLHVVDADIEAFFDQVHHDTLLRQLRQTIHDPGIEAIVALWLAAIVREGDRSWLLVRGIPQGSPLSPLLANLYLDDFDEALLARFPGLVRYADDFLVLVRTPEQAQQALALAGSALAELRLKLHVGKTRVTSFDEGFDFLGVRFRGRLVEAVQPESEPWLIPGRRDEAAAARHDAAQALVALARGQAQSATDGAAAAPLPRSEEPAEPSPGRMLDAPADESLGDEPGLGTGSDDEPALVRLSAEPVAAPLLQSLYVGEPGTWLSKQGERVVITRDREVLASVALGQVDQIAVFANAMVSTALLRHCAEHRVAVYLADAGGGACAHLERGALPDLELFDLQRRRHRHDAFNTTLARAYVEGKLHNSKVVMRRFTRRDGREDIEPLLRRIDECISRLPGAPDCATVRGLEGAAARAYFDGMKLLLPDGLGFGGRRRRPPQDPVNALLSFGYAVLAANMQSLLRLQGLNVHFGALHVTAPGSQALVSDLMEEFRAPVVDAVALTLLRDGRITGADFEYDAGAELPCRLKRETRRSYVKALENKLESRFLHPRARRVMDIRRAMQFQVQHYVRVLQRDEPIYLPLKLK